MDHRGRSNLRLWCFRHEDLQGGTSVRGSLLERPKRQNTGSGDTRILAVFVGAEGVAYVAETAGAYWLLDEIA